MKFLKNQTPRSLLISAIILRLFFSALFFHPDIKSYQFDAQFLRFGVFDIYTYIAENSSHLGSTDQFVYPPLAYFILGTINIVSGIVLGPGFYIWLNDWGPGGYLSPHMFEYMLILKFPYLILDLLLGYLLIKALDDHRLNEKLLAFWFFNPVSLYAIYMLSQFDVISAVLTVVSFILVKKNRLLLAAALLGGGILLKSYPLLLLPFVFFRSRDTQQLIIVVLGALAGFIIPLLPVINSSVFMTTMQQSTLMQRIFTAGIEFDGGQKIPLYVFAYAVLLWLSWQRRRNPDLLPEFATTTFLVLLLSHFHGQWVIWSLPFLSLVYVKKPRLWPVFLTAALGYFATTWLIADQWVILGIFSPINNLLVGVPPLTDFIKSFVDPALLQSLAHTLLAASGLWIIYAMWNSYET